MSAVFGWFSRDGAPVPAGAVDHFVGSYSSNGPARVATRTEGSCVLGRALVLSTPEDVTDELPIWLPERRALITAEARLDDREALCSALELRSDEAAESSDARLVALAYARWGEQCAVRLIGDWSFAVWHPHEQKLHIVRDVLGVTQLFVHTTPQRCAFASSFQALASCPGIGDGIDDVQFAHLLTSWPREGNSTILAEVKRVVSGEWITVVPERLSSKRYWDWSSAAREIRLGSDAEYVEGFRDVFGKAVRDRIRTVGRLATTLSGGLDSGSVTFEAAHALNRDSQPLIALSHVPRYPDDLAAPTGDERWAISQTAGAAGITDLTCTSSADQSPIGGMVEAIDIHGSPLLAASNQFWIIDLLATARGRGAVTVLVGQAGNETISWRGPQGPEVTLSWPLQWARAAWRTTRAFANEITRRSAWSHYSPIRPEFADAIRLREHMREDAHSPDLGPPAIEPGRLRVMRLNSMDATLADKAITFGLSIRDPTCDRRVVAYCLGIPASQFSTASGEARWLIRRAMRGRLPDAVLDQRSRGRQAADFGRRLRDEPALVEGALTILEADARARHYLDVPLLRAVWRNVAANSGASYTQIGSVLARGLMAGLYLADRSVVKLLIDRGMRQ